MGKGSNLRSREKTWEPNGNGRTLYDKDAVPEGCDANIWHLSLYFAQKCDENLVTATTTNGIPVIYETLRNRLTNYDVGAIRAHARYHTIGSNWVLIVEKMIDSYFDNYYYPDSNNINVFCDNVNFDYYVKRVIATLEREQLLSTGKRVVQPDTEIKPSKRTDEEKETARILQRRYTEEELKSKMEEYKSRGNN